MSDVAAASAAASFASRARAVLAERGAFFRDISLYGLCSAAALVLDWGTLVSLAHFGVRPLVAAATGFLLGMALTYVLSITLVYAERRYERPWREAAVFVAIGFAGLGINQLSLWTMMVFCGLTAPIAKAPTAGVVFLFNFLLRRALLFNRPRS